MIMNRYIKSIELGYALIKVITKKAIELGVSFGSMVRWILYQALQNELAQEGFDLTPKLVKKDWSKEDGNEE